MGRSAGETRRLVIQGGLYRDSTQRLFERAGIGPGMKVLDVGSGAGDVAHVAAELVRPAGSVVGVDRDPAGLEVAHGIAAAGGDGGAPPPGRRMMGGRRGTIR